MKNSNRASIIQEFLRLKYAAVVGVARSGQELSNSVFDALRSHGFRTVPINPNAQMIAGEFCYPNLAALPEKPELVMVLVPPAQTLSVVKDAVKEGIQRIWIHQGASSPDASRYCRENGVTLVDGECVFMHLAPVTGGHKAHRWLRTMFGHMPR